MSQVYPQILVATKTIRAITNVGNTWSECWESLIGCRRHFAPIEHFIPFCPSGSPVAGIKEWQINNQQPPIEMRGRFLAQWIGSQIAIPINRFLEQYPDAVIGLIVASSHGEAGIISAIAENECLVSNQVLNEQIWRSILLDELAVAVQKGVGFSVPATTVSAACASAIVASGIARDYLQVGMFDACIVVSLDTLARIGFTGFKQVGAMSLKGCCPFDISRDGMTVGEAGVAFFLVREDFNPYGESTAKICGYGVNCNAKRVVEPSADGIISAIRTALEDANITPAEISSVFWHGTGTLQNDAAEAEASSAIFGSKSPPCTTTKGNFGHCMGASSGLNIAAACETLRTGLVPPVFGLRNSAFPGLDLVCKEPRQIPTGPVLVVALGFGGINAAIILSS